MKQKLCKVFALVMTLVLLVSMVACGSKDSGLSGTTWALNSGSQDGVTIDKDAIADLLGGEMTFEFEKDDKVTASLAGVDVEGTWSQDGDTVSVELDGQSMDLTYADGKLTMEQSGVTLEFAKK